MEKNYIFNQRKELKKRAHATVRRHWFILMILMLLLTLFGKEFEFSTMDFGNIFSRKEQLEKPGGGAANILEMDDILSDEKVWDIITAGDVTKGMRRADELSKKMVEDSDRSKYLGMRNGVLAGLMNSMESGMILARIAVAARSVLHSDQIVAVLFVVCSLFGFLLVYFLFQNVYTAVIRRMYLEARIYETLPATDVLHFAAVRKWLNAAWVLGVKSVFFLLWSLTIVGAFIKYYSYWAVPYIVAENPGVSAKDAIRLSRRMMNGHKLEAFKYSLTLTGWFLLGTVTFGITDIVYGSMYRMSCYSEFYAMLREEALSEDPSLAAIFNDPYLFEKADPILLYERYFKVVDEITLLHESRMVLTGAKKAAADWFGIWIGSIAEKKAYDDQEGRRFLIERARKSMKGEAYPQWLNRLWRKRKIGKRGHFFFLRNYTVWTLILLFISFSAIGWSWEVILHYLQTGAFANRGTLHGPWLPIYGTGGVIVMVLCNRFRKTPMLEFLVGTTLCGVLEYFSGWYLEVRYHERWWSYDGYFLNLHGRICAEGLLVFGVGCCIVIYMAAPIFDYIISGINQKILIGVCVTLLVLFVGDAVYSAGHPNMAEGAIESTQEVLQTELMTDTGAA